MIPLQTNRGGQITFHGPGQLVLYPILDLRRLEPSMHRYVDRLQQTLLQTCKSLGVAEVGCKDQVGVWVADKRKIGFIGGMI